MQGFDNIAWELGNEPNSLQNHFSTGLDGLQLGELCLFGDDTYVTTDMSGFVNTYSRNKHFNRSIKT